MPLLLLRHASAGDRDSWDGDDRRRPLDARGRRQAEAIAALARRYPFARLVSSPYDRCIQTLEPLARTLRLAIETREELAEERQDTEGAALVRALAGERAAVCCHGGLSERLVGQGLKKGESLVLALEGERLVVAERLRPR